MLTPAVNAIMVAYSPRSKPMISISNTGDVLTKVRITETLRGGDNNTAEEKPIKQRLAIFS